MRLCITRPRLRVRTPQASGAAGATAACAVDGGNFGVVERGLVDGGVHFVSGCMTWEARALVQELFRQRLWQPLCYQVAAGAAISHTSRTDALRVIYDALHPAAPDSLAVLVPAALPEREVTLLEAVTALLDDAFLREVARWPPALGGGGAGVAEVVEAVAVRCAAAALAALPHARASPPRRRCCFSRSRLSCRLRKQT